MDSLSKFFTEVGDRATSFFDSVVSGFGGDNQYSMEEDEIVDEEGYYYIPELQEDSSSTPLSFIDMDNIDEIESALDYRVGGDDSGEEDSNFIEDLIEKARGIEPLAKAAKGILKAGGIGGKRGSQSSGASRRRTPTASRAREERLKEAGRVVGSLTAPSARATSAAQMFARQNRVDVSKILASLSDPTASGPNIKLIVGNKLKLSRTA